MVEDHFIIFIQRVGAVLEAPYRVNKVLREISVDADSRNGISGEAKAIIFYSPPLQLSPCSQL